MSERGAAGWINGVLVVIVAFIGMHAVFVLFNGNPRNGIVAFVNGVSRLLLLPFVGLFERQSRLITCLIAALAYALLAGIALAINNKVRAGVRSREAGDAPAAASERGATSSRRT